ncbi:hypothetical protein ETN89_21140 (plasmid) [Photobacterium damselae subsp. damselae]|uniref:hypothetical protein n=1 Tax=Photobacterium damselae TaxID=38293 RepID=UPI00101122A4|nr:hypothetical protein [Photobacterium damselae]QAY37719.1 hypothetical protein ETN89_21140 [Photobacterium damselae subsp. damselae]
MLNISLNAFNQSTATPPLTVSTQDSSLPEPVITLLNDNTKLEAPYSLTTLQTQLQQQKAALNSTSSHQSSIDSNISDSLLGAIDTSTTELNIIGMWVEGGQAGFQAALELIGKPLLDLKTPKDSQNEDIFQLAMLDLLIHAKEYELNTDTNFMQELAFSLEYIGTGQHNTWIADLPPPKQATEDNHLKHQGIQNNHLVKMANDVWMKMNELIQQKKVGSDSLIYKALNKLSGGTNNILATLPPSVYNQLHTADKNKQYHKTEIGYFNPNNGGWITNKNNKMSPLMRLVFLSNMLQKDPEMSQGQLNTILTGNLKEINDLSTNTNTNSKHVYEFIVEFDNQKNKASSSTTDNQGWQNTWLDASKPSGGFKPTGVNFALDFAGKLNTEWLNKLYQNYPKRVLGDEDIKEINRIGDNVKMIQQTLKYWYQIMRDERIAIARNI